MATNDKYDRQLRLWGAKGQRALGDTCVVLVGGTAAGTETLKNLVLPGIGSFCVIDNVMVTKEDVASNFFVTGGIGEKPRAQVACENLQELNPDVLGAYFHVPTSLQKVQDWKELLYKETNGKTKLLVVASDLDPPVLEALSKECSNLKLPLVQVTSYGLVGCVKLQLSGKVPLLDPKPANAPPDLRLKKSFAALDEFCNSMDLDALESHEHGHVPYPIILLKAIAAWRAAHGGQDPKTFPEKNEFKDSIKNMSKDINKEVNFEEAIQFAYLAYTEREVEIPEDLEGDLAKLYQALETFQSKHDGREPLNGAIPDMTASTNHYVKLQQIYKTQAELDLQEMKELVAGSVPEDAVESFCANVYSVSQISTRSLVDEITTPPDAETIDDLKMHLMDPYEVEAHTPLLWYLGLRACHVFFQTHGRYPGTQDDWESDAPRLEENYQAVALHYGLAEEALVLSHKSNICHELTRYANAEIHNIGSVLGGVASQEAVKIITGQYIPLNNTYLFNGIVAVGGVYKF